MRKLEVGDHQENPGQKVSDQKVSSHKVSKSDSMCQKVYSQNVSGNDTETF